MIMVATTTIVVTAIIKSKVIMAIRATALMVTVKAMAKARTVNAQKNQETLQPNTEFGFLHTGHKQ